MKWEIINGNSAEMLKNYPDNYFDSVVTDPPYGINFLGKSWDSNVGEEEVYRECLRVLKPGGHLLAFSAARTYHHLAMTVERVGFEIRDQIMWIYGSGFPKSQDVGRQIDKSLGFKGKQGPLKRGAERMIAAQDENGDTRSTDGWTGKNLRPYITLPESEEAKRWSGWGNALKPAHEPIVVAQKPMKTALYKNVQEWGTGAFNIDRCRVGDDSTQGRFPANVIHDGSDEVVDMFPNSADRFFYTAKVSRNERHVGLELPEPIKFNNPANVRDHPDWDPSIGTNAHRLAQKIRAKQEAARFCYTAKVSRNERNVGCENIEPLNISHDGRDKHIENPYQRHDSVASNNHPTVKPVALMRYLVKLVTPPRGRVLDPFNGSGSTGMAAVELGHEYLGIEMDPRYCEISRSRITGWIDQLDPITRSPLFGDDDE